MGRLIRSRRVCECRSCGSTQLTPVLDLGETPLANALVADESEGGAAAAQEPRFRLDVAQCEECFLVQLLEELPRDALFSDYVYFSSYADTTVESARALVEAVLDERGEHTHFVGEVASNDGYLLQHYRAQGCPVLGVEPASNVAEVAVARGIETEVCFFDAAAARRIATERGKVDVVHANNVLAHVTDLDGFVVGLREWLAPGGDIIVEVPYLGDLVERLLFDTIYHEHLCYFSLHSLVRLFSDRGLVVRRVERIPSHGGSLRLWATHRSDKLCRMSGARVAIDASVRALLDEERAKGVTTPEYLRDFGERVRALGATLRATLAEERAAERTVAAYGASAKSTTLLHALGLSREDIAFIADRSPKKQGKRTPGTHIPIVPPSALLHERPDVALLLCWNFEPEVVEQQKEFLDRGGRFLVPLPAPRWVSCSSA